MRKVILGVLAGSLLSVGAAGAATHYLITSTHQIKPSVLHQLKGNTGPVGPQGAQGLQGLAGAQGLPGISGRNVVTVPGTVAYGSRNVSITAVCPAGQVVIGDGFSTSGNDMYVTGLVPGTSSVTGRFGNPGVSNQAYVYAICATVS